jgi:hypothetical protein
MRLVHIGVPDVGSTVKWVAAAAVYRSAREGSLHEQR